MDYDVIVVGAGHAGCEAALAAARMGCRTAVFTMVLEHIALMPCNPSIGGPAKGHLVREIDALGGAMARVTDRTFIQIRTLNSGKGPAVQALRAQADKALYGQAMRAVLEAQPGLDVVPALIEDLAPLPGDAGVEVRAADGRCWRAHAVVLTTGTSLRGRLICGETVEAGGRRGEPAASALSGSLRRLSLELGRLKTGTPPRIDAHSIDYSATELQRGSDEPLHFSFWPEAIDAAAFPTPNPAYPNPEPTAWRPQLPCYLVHTSEATHAVIRAKLHRAPMFNGTIEGTGPRYCPSIEDKVVRFAHKPSHQVFLEPEGWQTDEVYVQGFNTSLPADVQDACLRTIPALAECRMLRPGYAVEYDYVLPHQTTAWLACKAVPGLFFAGQINGTSGYEEAAGQGLLAGINAALHARRHQDRPLPGGLPVPLTDGEAPPGLAEALAELESGRPLVLPRSLAYLGVMVDDLTTSEISEPYRLHTSRAEYRLLLRQDNADLRLAPLAFRLGLLDEARYAAVEAKRAAIRRGLATLRRTFLPLSPTFNARLRGRGLPPIDASVSAAQYLHRPEVGRAFIAEYVDAPADVLEQIEIEGKYAGYIRRQVEEVERLRRLEAQRIPETFDYERVTGLRTEARQKLARFRPATVAAAGRIAGVTPADLSLLIVWLQRAARTDAVGVPPERATPALRPVEAAE